MVLFPVGMLLIGWGLSDRISPLSAQTGAETVTRSGGVRLVTTTRRITRTVKGRVVHLPGQQVVLRIPYIVVRTDHHRIVVPAHTVGLPSPQAAVATPTLPVTVTVYVPTTVTVDSPPVTVTVTATTTDSVISTTTISLPLDGETSSESVSTPPPAS